MKHHSFGPEGLRPCQRCNITPEEFFRTGNACVSTDILEKVSADSHQLSWEGDLTPPKNEKAPEKPGIDQALRAFIDWADGMKGCIRDAHFLLEEGDFEVSVVIQHRKHKLTSSL